MFIYVVSVVGSLKWTKQQSFDVLAGIKGVAMQYIDTPNDLDH